jgi:hypothetical protein
LELANRIKTLLMSESDSTPATLMAFVPWNMSVASLQEIMSTTDLSTKAVASRRDHSKADASLST